MKVIFFSPKFHPEPNYYINDVVFDIEGLDKVIICGKKIDTQGFIIRSSIKNITTYYIPYRLRKDGGNLSLFFEYASFFLSSLLIIPYAVIREMPKKIFFYGISPPLYMLPFLMLKPFFRFKIVYWVQDIWPESIFIRMKHSSFLYFLINLPIKLLYKFSDDILLLSRSFDSNNRFKKFKHKIQYLPQGHKHSDKVTIDTYSSNIINNIRQEKRKVIVYAGNVANSMYLEKMAEAVEFNSKNFVFYIIGDGDFKEALVQKKYKSVIFFNLIDRKYIQKVISEADFAYLGRKLESDNMNIISKIFPGKLSLYMLAELPIISIVNMELYNFIKVNNLGYPIKFTTIEDLSESLKSILEDSKIKNFGIKQSQNELFKGTFDHKEIIERIYNIITK
ncbi:hypothetical protein N9X10_00425 [Gammaproteobacteria bacterium]|jgi:hypothetical protein|nr:hypothetical protein [Gammaproteobacteria bacterium]